MSENDNQIRENSFGWLVKMVSLSIDKKLIEELQPLNLNLKSFAILIMLSEKEGVNQTELGMAVGVPGYTTTRTLDIMEGRGLLERRSDPNNRRTNRIFLTSEGKALTEKLPPITQRVNVNFLRALNKNERVQLVDTLKKLLRYNSQLLNKDFT